MVILVVFNSFNVVKNLKKPDLVARQKSPFYTTHVFFLAIASISRTYEVLGQTNSAEINPKCLKVKFERAYNR